MWTVTDGENYGIRVRYEGFKRLVMYYLCGNGDVRSRTGYIVDQSGGVYTTQFSIQNSSDSHTDKNWKKFTLENIDYFYFSPDFYDDSIHLFTNTLK
ncbi:hypothetical protein D3C73_1176870 [compost metagenome]